MVFHREQTATSAPPTIQHILGDRRALPVFAATFRQFSPQVALDVIPYWEQDALTLMQTLRGITGRVVALSSQDVYRAYGLFTRLEQGLPETTPYNEDAPLRTQLYPYRALARGPDELIYHYEKILVERAVMNDTELPGTILRLPQVYGSGDSQHRLFDYLKRMDDGRRAILLDETQCGCCRRIWPRLTTGGSRWRRRRAASGPSSVTKRRSRVRKRVDLGFGAERYIQIREVEKIVRIVPVGLLHITPGS